MLKNWLLTSLRVLRRNSAQSIIKILGLALGMSCGLVILLLVKYDLSIDNFQINRDRIYRVTSFGKQASEYYPGSAYPLAKALRTDFPEFEQVVHISYVKAAQFTFSDISGEMQRYQEEEGIAFVEHSFLEVFHTEWLAGDIQLALKSPNSIVLTESLAKKYFSEESALNKVIQLDNERDLKVTGVIKDFPSNTNFPFTALISFESLKGYDSHYEQQSWNRTRSSLQAYVLLKPNVRPENIEARFPAFIEKHMNARAVKRLSFLLQPLNEIHFDTRYFDNFNERTVSKQTIFALILLSVFMIVTACINFVNLTTAEAVKRGKEIGIRKVVGSSRSQLILQFMGETALITLLAGAVSFMFIEVLLRVLPQFMTLDAAALQFDLTAILFFAIITVVVIAVAGLYPSFVMSKLPSIQAIKHKTAHARFGRPSLRSSLVLFQFAVSQILIIAAIVVTTQIDYFLEKPLGFDKESIVTVPLPDNAANKLESFRNRLVQQTGIINLSFSNGTPLDGNVSGWEVNYRRNNRDERMHIEFKYVDEHYLDVYDLQLLVGRKLLPEDTQATFLVNESFARRIGIMNPGDAIGESPPFGGPFEQIVGVVKDFHTQTFHQQIAPCFLVYSPEKFVKAGIKIDSRNLSSALQHIESAWTEIYPEHLFSYDFLDEKIASFYQEEQRISRLIKLSAAVIILIGCLGLYGLASFMVSQKTKEIGIRKVLGASVTGIFLQVSRKFVVLVGIANLIAWPIAYYIMSDWLQNYAYHISLDYSIFVGAALIAIMILLVTIGYQSVKAALANPIESLRYE